MRGRFLMFASAISLLVCLATAALWGRSYWMSDHFWYIHRSGRTWLVRGASGIVEFEYSCTYYLLPWRGPKTRFEHPVGTHLEPSDPSRTYSNHGRWAGFGYGWSGGDPPPTQREYDEAKRTRDELAAAPLPAADDSRARRERDALLREWLASLERRGTRWEVQVPAWFIVGVTLILPAWWVRRWRRTRHRRRKACALDVVMTCERRRRNARNAGRLPGRRRPRWHDRIASATAIFRLITDVRGVLD